MVFRDWTEDAPALPYWFRQIECGPHANFHYLLGNKEAKEAMVVDPAFELDKLWPLLEEDGYKLTAALITHGHWDHLGGIAAAVKAGVKDIFVHEKSANHPLLKAAAKGGATVHALRDSQQFVAASIAVEALWTPGHQPDETCFLIGRPQEPKVLFSGDTLFIGSCGRTDMAGGSTDHMFASMQRLRALAATPDIHVFPGHHHGSAPHRKLSEELLDNLALAVEDRDKFAALECLRE